MRVSRRTLALAGVPVVLVIGFGLKMLFGPAPSPLWADQGEPVAAAPDLRSRGPHTFQMSNPDGTPVTFSSCRPVHYVVNPAGAPEHGVEVVHEAVRDVAARSGLTFVYDGETDEVARQDRPLADPRYGNGYSPVLITWQSTTALGFPDAEAYGVASSDMVEQAGKRYIVTGQIVLNVTALARLEKSQVNPFGHGAVARHELAHIVGLDHVHDKSELMNDGYAMQQSWGKGDAQGLARAGAGGCAG